VVYGRWGMPRGEARRKLSVAGPRLVATEHDASYSLAAARGRGDSAHGDGSTRPRGARGHRSPAGGCGRSCTTAMDGKMA
jgi:hypothetical protein